jgi:uncharacterized protein, YfiH family
MYVRSEALTGIAGVAHAFFTREGGVSEGIYASLNLGLGSADERAKVMENRARAARVLGVAPDRLVSAYQIHSPDCLLVEAPWRPEDNPRVDALVTRMPGIAVCAGAADCGPILFADPEARVVGAAHAGWKGAFTGVLEATLARMEEAGATRARVVAAIGPMISQAAYEVGPEFLARFLDQDAANARFFAPSRRADHHMFDLPAYLAMRLTRAGVGRVDDVGLCTYSDPARFFSYRRTTRRGEPDYGRHLAAIALQL